MVRCDFQRLDASTVVCSRCSKQHKTRARPELVYSVCLVFGPHPEPKSPEPVKLLTPADLPCVHRGEFIETVACVPCRSHGKDGADVFACSIHGRCMMHNFSPRDIKERATACATCEDRR